VAVMTRDEMVEVVAKSLKKEGLVDDTFFVRTKAARIVDDLTITMAVRQGEIEYADEGPLTLTRLQREHAKWVEHNFPGQESWVPLLGAVEELGELAHAHIKSHQGIRGSAEKHEAKGRDAIGDVLIYLAHYATNRGWDLQQLMEETWAEVIQRDWIKDPLKGGES
jgi:NTP pyrophosphatase (non-canonical NTP hydrolase)